jgi:hypothetical protein
LASRSHIAAISISSALSSGLLIDCASRTQSAACCLYFSAADIPPSAPPETGKLADFVVLSDDILSVPERKIVDMKALATYVGGNEVYRDPSYQ